MNKVKIGTLATCVRFKDISEGSNTKGETFEVCANNFTAKVYAYPINPDFQTVMPVEFNANEIVEVQV